MHTPCSKFDSGRIFATVDVLSPSCSSGERERERKREREKEREGEMNSIFNADMYTLLGRFLHLAPAPKNRFVLSLF